jgi:hypothetical protein
MEGQPFLIEGLVGQALTTGTIEAATPAIQACGGDLNLCNRIASALAGVPPPNPRLGFESEQLLLLDEIHRSPQIAEKVKTAQRVAPFYDELFSLIGMPHRQRVPAVAGLKKRWIDEFDRGADDPAGELVVNLTPRFSKVFDSMDETNTMRDGFRVMLAIEIYRHDKRTSPGTLTDLVPEYLKSLPNDPYAESGTFKYRRLEPGSDPAHREYLLYSVAFDGNDDGGRQNPEGNTYVFLDAVGFDYIVNPVPHRPRE